MVVFDNWKFREILKSIVEKKELNGDRISSKQQLYMRIGEALHVSPDTVKYWQRDKSSGPDPRTPELLKELEDYLGYPDALQKKINIEEEKTEDKRMDKVSEFQKQQIMDIYEVLKNFVSEMNIEDEDEYYRVKDVIERKKLVLPETIFNAIMQFMDNVVEEYVFDAERPAFTEEEAEYENGVMNIKTDAVFNKLMSQFLERLQELDEKIDQFAERELGLDIDLNKLLSNDLNELFALAHGSDLKPLMDAMNECISEPHKYDKLFEEEHVNEETEEINDEQSI